jgi:hypothetical protein
VGARTKLNHGMYRAPIVPLHLGTTCVRVKTETQQATFRTFPIRGARHCRGLVQGIITPAGIAPAARRAKAEIANTCPTAWFNSLDLATENCLS